MFDGHGFGGGFMWLFWILVIVAIAWVVRTVVAAAGDGKHERKPRPPLEILEERFARGEIDEQEFESKRKLLRG